MTIPQLAPDEPLSPELVLVLPPELRAQALARLGPPVRPTPRPRLRTVERAAPAPQPAAAPPQPVSPPPLREPLVRSVATLVLARAVQLGVIFLAVTILTLALSLVAQAFR